MTFKVDRLSVRLPSGFGPQANTIAHQIGAELVRQSFEGDINIAHLQLPPISVSMHEGGDAVAQKAVAAIMQGIKASEGRRN